MVCDKIKLSLYFIGMYEYSPVNYGFDANIASSIAEHFCIYISSQKAHIYNAPDT
jgi:hypothetical protein